MSVLFGEEFGDIISFAMHNHPARVLGAVLSNLYAGELGGHGEQISEEYRGRKESETNTGSIVQEAFRRGLREHK